MKTHVKLKKTNSLSAINFAKMLDFGNKKNYQQDIPKAVALLQAVENKMCC
jgi:hypothetical protein